MFAASILFRFISNPSQIHLGATKRVLRYVKGTTNYGIKFERSYELKLFSYSGSDWAGSINDMKNTSSYAFFLGSKVFS